MNDTLKRAAGVVVAMWTTAALAQIEVQPLGRYVHGPFESEASEIAAHDPGTQRLYVVNGFSKTIDILSIANPQAPALVRAIDLSPWGRQANSVATRDGIVAAAVESAVKTDPGAVVFFDVHGNYLKHVTVGALPDMLTFTPNGRYVLVANEGEPDPTYTVDPEGSVSIIDLSGGVAALTQAKVRTAGFAQFNNAQLHPSIRIFGPGATVAQDLEPEYIAVSHDSKTAWVTLQENNALGILDIPSATFTSIEGLGLKNHSWGGNGLDASDRDNAINIRNWPVKGLYMPDAIASFKVGSQTFLVTANEGDSRDYPAYSEETRVASLPLDPVAFPNAAFLKQPENLGRLKTTLASGDLNGDGLYEEIHTFGARSFSIRNANGGLVWDSGDKFEQLVAKKYPANFNSDHGANNFDQRSDDKGPEPEGLTVGKAFGKTYVFVGLERMSGFMIFDVSQPTSPTYVDYVNPRDFNGSGAAGTAGELGAEGLLFIKADDSPTGNPLLVMTNEVSSSTAILEIRKKKKK